MLYGYYDKEVVIKSKVELSATITMPKDKEGKSPAVVIVAGSGGIDRDGNIKKMRVNIYKELAEFLAGMGFVTLRYDKRGVGKSKGNHIETGFMDLADDVGESVEYIKTLPYVDKEKIILLGHSEGCMLSMIVSATHNISGMILLAGAGIGLRTALQYQNQGIVKEIGITKGLKGILLRLLISEKKISEKQNKLFNRFIESKKDVIRVQLIKQPAKWFREHFSYSDTSFLDILKTSTSAIISLTGDKDVQANSDDLKKIVALNKENINCIVIEDMDHLLREYSGEKTLLNIKKQYKAEMGKCIHPSLIEHIKVWCEENYGEFI